jgi:ADP-heptose:LPS heptosyltransferase
VNRLPNIHIVDRYMNTTKAFGIVNDNKGLDYFIPKEDEVSLASLPSDFKNGFVAYAIGGQHQGKIVPTHKIVAICDGIQLPLVLLGGKEDFDRGEQIAHQTNNTVLNACGKYNLNQSASLLKQAQLVITHDTGLMHIASAFKKKIISIWGATVPAFGMYPYLPGEGSVIVIPKGEKHKPYSKLGNKQWYKAPYKGMERIDVEDVIALVNEK